MTGMPWPASDGFFLLFLGSWVHPWPPPSARSLRMGLFDPLGLFWPAVAFLGPSFVPFPFGPLVLALFLSHAY